MSTEGDPPTELPFTHASTIGSARSAITLSLRGTTDTREMGRRTREIIEASRALLAESYELERRAPPKAACACRRKILSRSERGALRRVGLDHRPTPLGAGG